jgi:DNA mismatch endonuclease (patch repair protein)
MTDRISIKKRREIMAKVKSKNTDIELILRKLLWNSGYRYRTNYKIFGKPDIAFPKQKIAIFCDGDFWHGKNYEKEKKRYKKFWAEKIYSNIKRDEKVNKELKKAGWKVIRFWKTDILKNPDKCVKKIKNLIPPQAQFNASIGKTRAEKGRLFNRFVETIVGIFGVKIR